jgi:geranylgeranyl diphosphate synthase type II
MNLPNMGSLSTSIETSPSSDYFDHMRRRIEAALSNYLPEVNEKSSIGCPNRLASAMRYCTLGGGKRLRAILCLMAADACGAKHGIAMPAACALEMVHCYSLIHDDLPAMDNDDLRRGRSTCHRAFDEATAILSGDCLLTLAFEILVRDIKPDSVALHCVKILAEASGATGMIGGQMVDLEMEEREGNWEIEINRNAAHKISMDLLTLEYVHYRKTGALLCAPLLMGAVIAGASENYISALKRFGKAIGLAFQIVDDLLDLEGEESKVGKRVRKDSTQGKWTYPRILGVDGSYRRARELAEEASEAIKPLGELACNLRGLALALLKRDR